MAILIVNGVQVDPRDRAKMKNTGNLTVNGVLVDPRDRAKMKQQKAAAELPEPQAVAAPVKQKAPAAKKTAKKKAE